MSESEDAIAPVDIQWHRKSRVLEIAFSDGARYTYSCEFLRVFSPAEAAPGAQPPVYGKKAVDLAGIEPQGTSALQLQFDDGHTCDYSWSELHALGAGQAQNWQDYLQRLREHGLQRGGGEAAEGGCRVRLLYFIQLAKIAGGDGEEVELPDTVTSVETLLAWLRGRGDAWSDAFAADRVQVTVNKHFAELFTPLEDGDEVAIVPRPE